MKSLKRLALVATLNAIAASGFAITFDFEGQSVGTTASVVETEGGLTMTITRTLSDMVGIQDLGNDGGFGSRSLSPFAELIDGDWFVANFSAAISSFSAMFADYGADDDGAVTITAYSGLDGSGSVVDSTNSSWNGDIRFDPVGQASVSGAGIRSVLFKSNGNFDNSLFWDNIEVERGANRVPDSGTSAALLGLGLAGLIAAKRRFSI